MTRQQTIKEYTDEELIKDIKDGVETLSDLTTKAASRGLAVEIGMANPENEIGVHYAVFKVTSAYKNLMPPAILRLQR